MSAELINALRAARERVVEERDIELDSFCVGGRAHREALDPNDAPIVERTERTLAVIDAALARAGEGEGDFRYLVDAVVRLATVAAAIAFGSAEQHSVRAILHRAMQAVGTEGS